MPRYYFDIVHQGEVESDKEGSDLSNSGPSRRGAECLIAELAGRVPIEIELATLIVEIREGDATVTKAMVLATRAATKVILNRDG